MGYIPSDVQSLRSQATYSSGLPGFASGGGPFGGNIPGGKRGTSYASSIISQDAGPSSINDSASVIGSTSGASSVNLAFSQSDRIGGRRNSFGSSSVAGASDFGSISDYKSQDDGTDMDDMKSQYAGTQSGVTVY